MWCGSTICQTRSGTDTVLRRHSGEGEYNNSTSQLLIYMPDQLNSVRDVLDGSTGTLQQSYDYTPYGAVARSNGSKPTDYEFAGLFYHPASTLNLGDARAMDGSTGRWLNRDPIREASNANLYAYAGANTINRTDPSGLMATCLPGQDIGNPQCQIQAGAAGPAQLAASYLTPAASNSTFIRSNSGCTLAAPSVVSFSMPYQSVLPVGLLDLPTSGAYRRPGSAQGRYFTSGDQASFAYARQSITGLGNMPYPMLRTRAPYTAFNGLPPATGEFGIQGWAVSDDFLPGLKPVVTNFLMTGGAP